MSPPAHDVAIVGAGPVGGTLALALADADLDVIVLDARDAGTVPNGDRSLALSHGARLILERLGVWARLERIEDAITPITSIDISQARGFGSMQLSAAEQGIPALGYVVAYASLQRAIDAALEAAGIVVRFATSVAAIDADPVAATVASPAGAFRARLAAVADGSGAAVAGVTRVRHDYGQVALVASVWCDRPHAGVAYERFTASGPVALLPERDHYGLVWTMTPERAQAALAQDEQHFLAGLAAHFGTRVTGFVRATARRTFPLVLEQARPAVAARTVLIGNAAQQLHPVAGQGFNLGLRDAFELAQLIAASPQEAIGTPSMLARYAARRARDRTAAIAFTHGLVRVFGNDLAAVRWPRGLALAALDALPPLKRVFARAMLHGA